MRQILNKSSSAIGFCSHNQLIHAKSIQYNFSSMPPNMAIQKAVQFQFKFRSLVKLPQLYDYIISNSEDIKKYGKTILLEFLNEYPMQSFKRSRDQLDSEKRQEKYKLRQNLYLFLNQLEELNFYQLNMRYSIFKKLVTYIGPDERVIKQTEKYEAELVNLLKTTNVHMSDIINWLYMLPLNYPQEFSTLAFDLIEAHFENPEVRQFLKSQRSLPALIKRIYEKDWSQLRKYKNIIKFLCYEASLRDQESPEDLAISLQRIVMMKLHVVGEKVIPKMVDEIMERFNYEFELLTKNKQTLLKVFSAFKYLPISYNLTFFNKIHNHLKGIKQLPSHILLYLPYNKLSQSEISYLQTKMFTAGREDIAPKLIYTIYEPEYKNILTPFIIKEAYTNLMDMWKKESHKFNSYFQVYLALIFRFSNINSSMIEQSKIRGIFHKLVSKAEQQKYEVFQTLSAPGIISFFELVHAFDARINEKLAYTRIDSILSSRRERNTTTVHTGQLLAALKVHYNASSKKSRQLLTSFIHDIVHNKDVEASHKIELMFIIQKTMRPEQKWSQYSAQLSREIIHDIDAFVQIYIKYESKTLKLTNYVFNKLYERKVDLFTVLELLGSLNLKLLTSLKGKLISPLKKYITELNLSDFDLTKSSLNSLVQSYRVLFYFKNEIPEFIEFMSIKLIEIIEEKCKQGEYVNGKQFAFLSSYVMQALANIDIKRKTEIIESIVSIIKTLRKKEGIYLKVYELDFLCSNQKFIKINSDVLEQHWTQIVETLKKTDRVDHHKDLFFLALKLHCREFVELNSFDLRYFVDKCTEMVDDSILNMSQIKECLGYEILNCQDEFVIQKLKIYLSNMVKLAFRKDKRKHSYFMYEYYLKFFSKLQSKEMITQICQKLLYEKLYPVEVSNIVPILNKNEIKNKKFVKRILDIMSLSDAYVSYEKLQVISWLEKISYELPEWDYGLVGLRNRVSEEIIHRTSELKRQMKTTLGEEDRSIEDGFQVQDPNFDKNYKVFIQYAWSCLKSKSTNTPHFKFICRYLFFSIDKIKARIQNPQERKQLSKIKLYHVLKFLRECGFFEVDEEKLTKAVRQKNVLKDKIRKVRLLNKMEKDLSVMKIESSEKLETILRSYETLKFVHKGQVGVKNIKVPTSIEYLVQEYDKKNPKQLKNRFIIHTVKKYHCTPQLFVDQLPSQESQKNQTKSISSKDYRYTRPATTPQQPQQSLTKVSIKEEEEHILDVGFNENQLEENENDHEQNVNFDEDMSKLDNNFVTLEETELSLELKPQKEYYANKEKDSGNSSGTKTVAKRLFSGAAKTKAAEESLAKKEKTTLSTVLTLEKVHQNLYKDYNGYLKVEKSLIQLTTGLKCIVYDPEKDIFFD